MKLRSLISAALVLGLVGLFCGPLQGRAQADGNAAPACSNFEECYRLALRLYKAEQIPEALAAFETAYGFQPEPNLLINIGRAHFRLGHPQAALDFYKRYLGSTATASAS